MKTKTGFTTIYKSFHLGPELKIKCTFIGNDFPHWKRKNLSISWRHHSGGQVTCGFVFLSATWSQSTGGGGASGCGTWVVKQVRRWPVRGLETRLWRQNFARIPNFNQNLRRGAPRKDSRWVYPEEKSRKREGLVELRGAGAGCSPACQCVCVDVPVCVFILPCMSDSMLATSS